MACQIALFCIRVYTPYAFYTFHLIGFWLIGRDSSLYSYLLRTYIHILIDNP